MANLWNLEDIRALNRREQAQIAQLPKEFVSPSSTAGVIASDASGATLSREQVLVQQGVPPAAFVLLAQFEAAQNPDAQKWKNPSGVEIANHAKALGELHTQWWQNEGAHHEIRKCNLFADRVFRDMHVPLPWDKTHIPAVHGMVLQLAKSSDWKLIYSDKQSIAHYKPQPGDFILWDKTVSFHEYNGTITHKHLEHSDVIGTEGDILYAGSDVTGGYVASDARGMFSSQAFGQPSVVYRSNHLGQ
jgi:hypothetical protein